MKSKKTNAVKAPKAINKKEETKAKAPKKTISSMVLNAFKSQPAMKSKEMIELVKKSFPDSKFNVYHFCWYRYQIKKGRYTKQFTSPQLEKIFAK